jgi:hypothetical protein
MTTSVTSAVHPAQPPRQAQMPDVRRQRRYLRDLIRGAGRGDSEQVQQLLRPFISEEERFVSWGTSARLGFIPRYNFYFLTDRRVGDLDVTPLTGRFNVEMAYLHKIDAIVIRQPAIVWLRIALIIMYAFIAASTLAVAYQIRESGSDALKAGIVAAGVLSFLVAHYLISPMVKRIVLRFHKSGMFLKLTGGSEGTYIFADRRKLPEMSGLSRAISELKRSLDVETV